MAAHRAAKLLIADTHDSDMRYATGLSIHDPFIWVRIGEGRKAKEFALVSSLELSRAKQEVKKGITVIHWDTVDTSKPKTAGRRSLADIAAAFLISHNIKEVIVPPRMWAAHVDALRKRRLRVTFASPFLPERVVKTPAEIAAIRRVGTITEKAFAHCVRILEASRIAKDRSLIHDGKKLTSEFLKAEMDIIFMRNGCAGVDTIVACGKHAAQPHNTGSGPLKAGEPIVFDIFPRDTRSGYYFDMSRTLVKGKPSAGLQKLYDAVLASQQAGLRAVKPGVKASAVHAACAAVFAERGYKTTAEEGFIHSTGHGVGLDIHERPSVSARSDEVLRPGMVLTVEPGLYYKKLGGVRIEDTVVVTATGMKNLTRAPKTFIIR